MLYAILPHMTTRIKTAARIFFLLCMGLLACSLFSCRRHEPAPQNWRSFRETQHDARLYAQCQQDTLNVVVCAEIAGIACSVRLDHACTQEQFGVLCERLTEYGAEDCGEVSAPDTEGFPDLTGYLPLVLSADELHRIWYDLGLEDEPY